MLNSLLAIYYKVIDKKLLKEYNKIWGRVSSLIGKEFNSEPVYGVIHKDIKTNMTSFEDKVNTIFQSKKVPKKNASYKCLSLIILNSVIRANKKYHQKTLLEVCKYD